MSLDGIFSFSNANNASGNSTVANEELKLLDGAITMQTDPENIVFNYFLATSKHCSNTLHVLWTPRQLILCEEKSRTDLLVKQDNITAYEEFDKTISLPFQQKSLKLFTEFKVQFSIVPMTPP